MDLTVAICTYNRADSLEDTLAHLCRLQGVDGLRWELLLVDNNCTDHTQEVVARFTGRLPLRPLVERSQGLSHGRNRALREARGDLLVFTDDDVRPVPAWLGAYADAARDYPEADYLGGRIQPWWPQGKPGWVRDINMPLLAGLFGTYDLGAVRHWYAPAELHPFGANFALRRSLFERSAPFRTDLGVVGSVPGRGEEAEYFQRASADGARGLYVPAARVLHRVDASHLTLGYLYRYGEQKGIASRRMHGDAGAPGRISEGAYLAKGLWQLLKGRGIGSGSASSIWASRVGCGATLSMPEPAGPLVSVIIPVYNRSGLLREAVQSALAQRYRPIEVLIVDDGSSDAEAVAAIAALVAEAPAQVRAIRIQNAGPGLARQAGLEATAGGYVQFLDSDDLLLPDKFALQVAGLEAQPDRALSYGKTREYSLGSVPADIPARRTGERFDALFPAVLDGRLWATETPLFRRSALQEIGPWSSLRVLEDWEYECRLGARGARLHYCDAFVSEHRHHGGPREGLRWRHDEQAFKNMLTAHVRVLEHARAAAVSADAPEMKRYARNLFRLARDAGANGMRREARRLLGLAAEIDHARRAEYGLYRVLARAFGWQRVAAWAQMLEDHRRRLTTSSGAAR